MIRRQEELRILLNNFLPLHEITYAETEKKEILGLEFYISGVAVKVKDSFESFGSSCSMIADPLHLAGYECIERYIVQSKITPNLTSKYCRFALSNGVAIHSSPEQAKENANFELLERNAILLSWYFDTPIKRISSIEKNIFPQSFTEEYDVYVCCFSEESNHCVTGIFAFPQNNVNPLLYGFGCDKNLELSIAKSKKEFISRMGFLWEEIADTANQDRKSGLYHQDFYLDSANHHHLRQWLNSKKYPHPDFIKYKITKTSFTNLTPNHWKKKLHIFRAKSQNSIPLFFGEVPKEHFDFPFRCDIPHPIT